MKGAYYNEIDPFAAQWLRNLIAAGHIAPGDVDERSIRDVQASDLVGYTQCHFFAGIGVWSHALRQAGWPDDQPVWTGSCPCQPFSVAGRQKGVDDERHLWPTWFSLIREHHPHVIFGEQVASGDALAWLDTVHADLERESYAVGVADLCAAGFGAPHIRQRLYFVAEPRLRFERVADDDEARRVIERTTRLHDHGEPRHDVVGCRPADVVGDTDDAGLALGSRPADGRRAVRLEGPAAAEAGVVGGFWRDADLLWCRDDKYRPVEPGTFPLAHGVAGRVGKLRAYGNAIVAPVAEAFVRAYLGTLADRA